MFRDRVKYGGTDGMVDGEVYFEADAAAAYTWAEVMTMRGPHAVAPKRGDHTAGCRVASALDIL